MEKWFLLNEFIVIIYYCWYHLRLGTVELPTILLSLLLFVCLKLTFYILKKISLKKILLFVILVFIIIVFSFIDKAIILLLPINVFLLAHYYKISNITTSILMLTLLPFINMSIKAEFALLININCLLYIVISKASSAMQRLTDLNDSLRKKNHYLQNRLDKDKSYENELKELSQLEERNKIAQQIHDNIGHTITGSVMQLEAAKALLKINPEKSSSLIDSTLKVLRKGMEQIRQTLTDIKPSSEQLGLHNLKVLLSETQKVNSLKYNLFYDENIDVITYLQWRVILKNVKEAITNTVKYSKATKLNIKIEVLNKLIKVEVKDNGIGALSVKKGLGILGMEERTQNLNGTVIIDGSNGFSVITILPL
ncbi:sensor histidine kinase [Clostridium sp. 'deep sea']|uniref:sensor histidine kinase n=1 Tax=Clostridium sp. 'deep sea' TaxID=2779445 RepID=UPI0018965D71|nr:sensor histidine kinase [Clostridium sp. 'deep sea']QOR35084.1 sensor histidine kinase [Clostridium sp. 'deep sea']